MVTFFCYNIIIFNFNLSISYKKYFSNFFYTKKIKNKYYFVINRKIT